ncbi:uncharacterized protein LOC144177864 [Haemaphysalis longicornis]
MAEPPAKTTAPAEHVVASAKGPTDSASWQPSIWTREPSLKSPDSMKTPELDYSKEAMCGSRAAKESNDVSAKDSTLLRVMSPAAMSPASDHGSHKNLEVVGTRRLISSDHWYSVLEERGVSFGAG